MDELTQYPARTMRYPRTRLRPAATISPMANSATAVALLSPGMGQLNAPGAAPPPGPAPSNPVP